jgi:hypothetical protein
VEDVKRAMRSFGKIISLGNPDARVTHTHKIGGTSMEVMDNITVVD